MSRCIYCDFSNELAKEDGLPGYDRRMKWDDKEQGFVCHVCTGEIGEALKDFGYPDEVEGSELLEDEGLEEHSGDSFITGD